MYTNRLKHNNQIHMPYTNTLSIYDAVSSIFAGHNLTIQAKHIALYANALIESLGATSIQSEIRYFR